MRLVFMGTPEFAVPTLQGLISSAHEVVGVVTQPDRPKGRGRVLSPPPVKAAALAAGLPVLQPLRMDDPEFLAALSSWRADCFVVVAFRILPPAVYEMPPRGTFNLHTSLLPKYRGAAPMQWAIMNGETETGLTTFLLDRSVDTGAILLQERMEIGPEETLGELHDRMAQAGVTLVLQTVDGLAAGTLQPRTQEGETCTAPKIGPQHWVIDWHRPGRTLVNQIRGLSPSPGAATTWQGKRLKIYRAVVDASVTEEPQRVGTVLSATPEGIVVQVGDGAVRIQDLQAEGRKRMAVDAFLRGCDLKAGDRLGEAD